MAKFSLKLQSEEVEIEDLQGNIETYVVKEMGGDFTSEYMNFLQKESCGICIPCREGTRRMHEILENITKKPKDENGNTTLQRFKGVMQLENIAEVLKDMKSKRKRIDPQNKQQVADEWTRLKNAMAGKK